MRVTTEGQVTIPQHIREKMGITPHTELLYAYQNAILGIDHDTAQLWGGGASATRSCKRLA